MTKSAKVHFEDSLCDLIDSYLDELNPGTIICILKYHADLRELEERRRQIKEMEGD